MKNFPVLLLFAVAPFCLKAQLFEHLNPTVIVDDTPLRSPWTGGVNAPQWSAADLNDDGNPDLFAFDRDGHVSMTFINEGAPGEINYRFAPEYLDHFPTMHDYVMLRDYDHDGAVDIFAFAGDEGVPGFKVFDGFYENNQLKFDRVESGHFALDVLTVPLQNGGDTNLNTSRQDYPAVNDVDGDGDLDIVSLFSVTGNALVYYKNMALEQGFTTDTLIFKTEETCWMGIFIPNLTTSLNLSCHPDSCANACPAFGQNVSEGRTGGIHGASTLLVHDFDGDGDGELLYGDLQFPHVNFVENDASSGTDWGASQDTVFPSYDESALLNTFPASFKIDIDNDGVLEFLFSPNTFSNTVRDVENVFLYENTGTNNDVTLEKVTENILQRDMIDVGSVSQPAFFDHNADGLMDFVVGNWYRVSKPSSGEVSSLFLFENTGTLEEPAFTLVAEDYLEFEQFSMVSGKYAPAFGDMDGDGDVDMLVGDDEGKLFYVQNNGGPGNPVDWAAPQYNYMLIDVTQQATPFIFDANQDDLPDLLIGHKQGTVMYFQNEGTASSPQFNPDFNVAPNNNFLGLVNTQDQSITAQGLSAPVVLELGDTTFLVTGGESGYLEVYVLDPDSLGMGQAFEKISEKFAGFYQGTHSRVSFANIDDDEYLEMLSGNHRGGLSLFKSPFTTQGLTFDAVTEKRPALDFDVFPNPTNGVLNIRLRSGIRPAAKYHLVSALGQTAMRGMFFGSQQTLDVSGLTPGIYFLEIRMDGAVGVRKVWVE